MPGCSHEPRGERRTGEDRGPGRRPYRLDGRPALARRRARGHLRGAGFRRPSGGIREAFGGFDPAKIASLQPADITRLEADPRVIRNKAKIEASVENAKELLAILRTHGTIRGYLGSFPNARSAASDLHRRLRFLGDTGVWRLLTSAAQDAG